jgi:hypothetical protein
MVIKAGLRNVKQKLLYVNLYVMREEDKSLGSRPFKLWFVKNFGEGIIRI